MLEGKGYIQVAGSWKTQQQVTLEQYFDRKDKLEKEWVRRVNALRSIAISDSKSKVELVSINDPLAAGALAKALPLERDPDVRILLIRALGNIGTSAALHEIARWSVDDIRETNNEVRRTCFEVLRKHPAALPAIVGFYARLLHADNGPRVINQAAQALGQIDGHAAIPQLIDALVTTHVEIRIVKAQGTTGMSSGTNTPGGLSWGEETRKFSYDVQNHEVRLALMRLTGKDFLFDKDAWKAWLIQSRRTPTFDARRG
jgi:HEAT repeat protein